MYLRNLLLILVFLTSSIHTLFAQRSFGRFLQERMELGIQAGTSGYIGEIDDRVYGFQAPGKDAFSVGASAKYFFNTISSQDRTWGVRADYNLTKIGANDSRSTTPTGYEFTNLIHEASAMAEFQFFEFRPNRVKSTVSPYIFGGIGMIWHNPKGIYPIGGNIVSLIDDTDIKIEKRDGESIRTVKPRKYSATIPFGVGVKYNLPGTLAPWSVGLEAHYRYVFNDFLDGIAEGAVLDGTVSSITPSLNPPSYLQNTNILDQRYVGDSRKDFFMTGVLKVTYTFYKWRDPLWR